MTSRLAHHSTKLLLLVWGLVISVATAWTVDCRNRRDALQRSCRIGLSLVSSELIAAATTSQPAWGASEVAEISYLSDISDFQAGPQGLRYKILKQGEGQAPVRGQQIYAKYILWTGGFGEDGGKQVDSNTGFMGQPLPVIVGIGRVIKGWDLTLLDMKVGENRRIVVPSDIGYGDRGAGGAIPPKATLYFEIEITGIDPLPTLTDAQKKWLEDNPL